MRFFSSIFAALAVAASLIAPADAGYRHGVATSSLLVPGKATINIGGSELSPVNFINILKTSFYNFTNKIDANILDSEGYPVAAPTATISLTFNPSVTSNNTQYKLSWPATRTFTFRFSNGLMSSCATVNADFTGCTNSNATISSRSGLAGSVTFTVGAIGSFTINIDPSGTFAAGSGEIALYRTIDETAYLAGEIFTTDFVNVVSALRPRAIRPMGWTDVCGSNWNGETRWAYRSKLTDLSWGGRRFMPSTNAGTAAGTDTYTVNPAPDTPLSGWVDGEVIQAVFTNANTVTTPTLAVATKTGGPKTIVSNFAVNTPVAAIGANSFQTLVYDLVLDRLVAFTGGQCTSVPVEAQIALANKVGANLWAVVPTLAGDDYVTQWATLVYNTLRSDLFFYPEYTNESTFNSAFPQTFIGSVKGQNLGLTSSSNRHRLGYYGLRVREIMGNLIPPVWSGRMAKLRRTLMYQAAGDITTFNYTMKGVDLAPSGVSTGQGNSLYCTYTGGTFAGTCTGGANYITVGNRPIDFVEVIGYAPYAGGANLFLGPDIGSTDTPTSLQTPFYQNLVNAWEAGQSASAIAMIDDDIRQGRTAVQNVTCSGTTCTTPVAHSFAAGISNIAFQVTGGTIYSGLSTSSMYRVLATPASNTFTLQAFNQNNGVTGVAVNVGTVGTGTVNVGWLGGKCASPCSTVTPNGNAQTMFSLNTNWYQFGEWLAAQFEAQRGTLAPVRVEQYEGSLELQGPTAGQLTTLGVTGTNPAKSITDAIEAWKASASAAATIQAYYNQFMGLDSGAAATFGLMAHSQTPAHLVLLGGAGNVWGLVNGSLPTSPPYQLYYGFQSYSTNWLLKRDLDPASNDNDPMWLEKAA